LDDPGRYLLLSLSPTRASSWVLAFTRYGPAVNVGRSASFGLLLLFLVDNQVLTVRRPGFV
jgi:hypothetical protein